MIEINDNNLRFSIGILKNKFLKKKKKYYQTINRYNYEYISL